MQDRFRQIPTFGQFTIRRFHNNVSEMKKLAARDFEDILQVCKCVLLKVFAVYQCLFWPVFYPCV